MAGKALTVAPRLAMRETIQKKILEEVIGNPASAGRWKVFIMDELTTRIVSSALTMFEIMEQNVSLVENLHLGRQSFPDMDAVYFVSPTMESARRIMGDFISANRAAEMPAGPDGQPHPSANRYGNVHLIFTGTVGHDIIDLLQSNSLLIGKVKTFKEVHLEFLATETFSYHLDMSDSLSKLYGRMSNTAYPAIIGRKLASLCISLNEHPNIRYQGSSAFAREIATTVNQALVAYKRANATHLVFGDDASSERERAQLLIVDRTFDPVSPFMHEYTYQAMANDLLDINANGTISYDYTTEKGTETKQALLNSEVDELWKEHRHKHIAKVIASIKERMDDILQTSAGARLAKKKGGDMDISSMAAAVKNLPEYTQTMSNLGRHVAITSQCMQAFTTQHLMELSIIEQTLSTGVDEENKEVRGRKATEMLLQVLSGSRVSKDLKVRLLAVFFVTQRPLSAEDRRQLITAARLSGPEQQLLVNLELLMGPLDAAAQNAAAASASAAPGAKTGGGFFSRMLGTRVAEKIAATAEGEYADTRHVCQLKVLLEQMMGSTLPVDRYPAMGPALPASAEAKSTAQSVRKYKGNQQDRWAGAKTSSQLAGGRVLAFVAGGISYGELRDGYELMNKDNREVVVGGTHFISPIQYMDDITNLDS